MRGRRREGAYPSRSGILNSSILSVDESIWQRTVWFVFIPQVWSETETSLLSFETIWNVPAGMPMASSWRTTFPPFN